MAVMTPVAREIVNLDDDRHPVEEERIEAGVDLGSPVDWKLFARTLAESYQYTPLFP